MKRFLRKATIGMLYLIAILVVLMIILHIEEDWRGARDWTAAQKELAAKGESLDLRQLVPPGKPEDDLSKVPIFAEVYRAFDDWRAMIKKGFVSTFGPDDSNARIHRVSIDLGARDYSHFPTPARYHEGEAVDLPAWQKYYRSIPEAHLSGPPGTPAEDVLKALSRGDPEMKEIEAALNNPHAYWPINYDVPFAGDSIAPASLLSVAKFLMLRAVAHLDNNEADLAEKDYLFSFRLNQALERSLIVHYLIAAANRSIDDEILWEGLRRHAWNMTQLQEMDSQLAAMDPLGDGVAVYRIERASDLQDMKALQTNDPKIEELLGSNIGLVRFFRILSLVRPSGWWDQDRSRCSMMFQRFVEAIDRPRGMIDPSPFNTQVDLIAHESPWRKIYTPMWSFSLSGVGGTGEKIAEEETFRRLTRLACRLEEYYLAHRQYPDSLGQLPDLPPHLNAEVVTGRPLHYWRKGDGYALYSTNWDGKDRGGVPRGTPGTGDEYDWVWPSP